jgi:hypothetical protein
MDKGAQVPSLHPAGGTRLRSQNLGPREEVRSSVREDGYAGASGVGHGENGPLELCCRLAPVGNFLCLGQEERTLRETDPNRKFAVNCQTLAYS